MTVLNSTVKIFARFGLRTSAILLLSTPAPALLSSCGTGTEMAGKDSVPTQIYISKAGKTTAESLDLFFFNDDSLRRLDAYQQAGALGRSVTGGCRAGRKILVGVANLTVDRYDYSDIVSYAALSGRVLRLEDEDPATPRMSGECRLDAGGVPSCRLSLSPLLSEIRLESVCCDFRGRSYEGQKLENVKVYLTNVCAESQLLPSGRESGGAWLNLGGLDSSATASMPRPGLLMARLPDIGDVTVFPGVSLYCYPNHPEKETFGTPYTKLVVEGTIKGQKCYYPIPVNQPGFGYIGGERGVLRNYRHAIHLTITRMGTSDPDIPAESGSVRISNDIMQWEENPCLQLRF